jgi:hypothetical protein
MLKKDIAKTHYNNSKFIVPNNAPLAVYQTVLARHWLVMGLKTDSSPINAWVSKIEAAIENITYFATVHNLAVNQLIEYETVVIVTAKVASAE